MPQPGQHSMVHCLLLWTTVLSIIQAVFIVLFFTAGHLSLPQNSSTVAPGGTVQPVINITPSPPSQKKTLGKGTMLTYKAMSVNGRIRWRSKNPGNGLLSDEGESLEIQGDGSYFLSLQVTLKKCDGTKRSNHTVSLSYQGNVILQGCVDANTCTTGNLGRVVAMTGGHKLEFNIKLSANDINETESLTFLDIIYLKD